jgi:hypothetical protein
MINKNILKLIKSYAKEEGYQFDKSRLQLTNGSPENGNTIILSDDGTVTHYCNGGTGFTEWFIENGSFVLL